MTTEAQLAQQRLLENYSIIRNQLSAQTNQALVELLLGDPSIDQITDFEAQNINDKISASWTKFIASFFSAFVFFGDDQSWKNIFTS